MAYQIICKKRFLKKLLKLLTYLKTEWNKELHWLLHQLQHMKAQTLEIHKEFELEKVILFSETTNSNNYECD